MHDITPHPSTKKTISFRLDPAQRQALARIAAREARTESQLIRLAIQAYIAAHERPSLKPA